VTLFAVQMKGLALFYLLLVAGLIALRPATTLPALARCAPILLLPAFALASALWSVRPGTTFYYGVEFLLTVVAAILIAGAANGRSAVVGLFAAFLLWGLANLAVGLAGGEFSANTRFVGLAGSKNAAGDAATLGAIVGVAMLTDAVTRRGPALILASLVLIGINVAIVAAAHSTGAMIAAVVGVGAVLLWTATRTLPLPARGVILVATIITAVVAMLTVQLWAGPLLDDLLSVSGKDTSLTGRTYIWGRAHVLISQRPWLGLGYSAFWQPGNLEAEAIWRELLIKSRRGFHFHNSALDLRVTLGNVGLALFAGIFLLYGIRLFFRTMRVADVGGILLSAMFLAYAARAPFESFGAAIFHQSTLLLIAALAWSTRPAPPAGTSGMRAPLLSSAR
jgi:exopolysaccharide production protein ExoQ